ncbi:MAG: hypothetical protein L3J74_11550 [Bacteroidales bacterium]|nr:hypothetical protein [Bacteroidales bacterium]
MKHQIMNFYSNGKLLISAEYLVMHGALALALPVKFGQSLMVKPANRKGIYWQTFVKDKLWFSVDFNHDFSYKNASNQSVAEFLSFLLKAARQFNPLFLKEIEGLNVNARIDFDINWGLGSSSSLINNVAQWAQIDSFDLFFKVANGSAYDIACAQSDKAIIYQLRNGKPEFNTVNFYPDFHQNIYFAYLGKKQKSEASIKIFKKQSVYTQSDIDLISKISMKMLHASKFNDFVNLVNEHEQIIAKIIKQKTVKELYFHDFPGSIKSLGAWGGDFIMILSKLEFDDIKRYFLRKKINTIFKFAEMLHD